MSKVITVDTADVAHFELGQKLRRTPEQTAYLAGAWAALYGGENDRPKECPLTTSQLAAVIADTDLDGLSPDAAEAALFDAINGMIDDGIDDSNKAPAGSISEEEATHRAIVARNLGVKLGKGFNDLAVKTLLANDDVKRGPGMFLDCIVGEGAFKNEGRKWTDDEILALATPFSSRPDGYTGQRQFDNYSTGSGENRISSNTFKDILAATPAYADMIKTIEIMTAQGKVNPMLAANKKTVNDRLNDEVRWTRQAVCIFLVMHAIQTKFPLLSCQLRRDDNGLPSASKYVINVWPKADVTTGKALTVGNCKSLVAEKYDPSSGGFTSGLDRALAGGKNMKGEVVKGGTLAAIEQLGLPRKPKGKGKGKDVPAIVGPDMFFTMMSRADIYGQQGGVDAVKLELSKRGEITEGSIYAIGQTLAWLLPVWDAIDGPTRYSDLISKTVKSRKTAA